MFRLAVSADTQKIMRLIDDAKEFLRGLGVDQWQSGYPNLPAIETDIAAMRCYVIERDGDIISTGVLSFEPETAYENLISGAFEHSGLYGVIHRLAVSSAHRGAGVAGMMTDCFAQMTFARGVKCIRTDTHRDNRPMRSMLEKNGFTQRGVILLSADGVNTAEAGSERIVYERNIISI